MVVFLWWCGDVFVLVWWCFCVGVVVFLRWCGDVFVLVWWCLRGGACISKYKQLTRSVGQFSQQNLPK